MTTASRVTSQLIEAAAIVGAAKDMLSQGNLIDLAGLEARVGAACDTIGQLDPAERDAIKQALVALIDELNDLALALGAQHAQIGDQITGSATREKAITAYAAGGRAAPRK